MRGKPTSGVSLFSFSLRLSNTADLELARSNKNLQVEKFSDSFLFEISDLSALKSLRKNKNFQKKKTTVCMTCDMISHI